MRVLGMSGALFMLVSLSRLCVSFLFSLSSVSSYATASEEVPESTCNTVGPRRGTARFETGFLSP